ncbi:MAG: hypothetical protein ACKVS8_10700 [Phycisphaerales bacterium]
MKRENLGWMVGGAVATGALLLMLAAWQGSLPIQPGGVVQPKAGSGTVPARDPVDDILDRLDAGDTTALQVRASDAPALLRGRVADVPTPTVQRFQIVFSPHMRRDTFLLDTTTGASWKMVGDKDKDEITGWERLRKEP